MTRQKRRPQNKRIPSAAVPGAKTLQFSFKHLDTVNPKFPVTGCTDEFWTALIHELKRYGQFTVDQFVDENNTDGRHGINFEDTSETGFTGIGESEDSYPWQFAVGDRQRGYRVAGYIADETFFIIWLDSQHALYPGGQNRSISGRNQLD